MSTFVSVVVDYLVNSLWMCPLIFAVAWLVSRVATRMGAQAEHAVWVGSLSLQVVLPACRIGPDELWQLVRAVATWPWRQMGADNAGSVAIAMGPVRVHGDIGLSRELQLLLAAAYASVVVYFVARLAVSVWRTFKLVREARPAELDADAAQTWERCRRQFGIEQAVVVESEKIAGPATVGFLRSALVVPQEFLREICGVDLAAAMAHECAHMRRRDFVKNLLYNAISLPLAYHPVAWWTLARIAESREMVCDAMAAEAMEGEEGYARSLLRLAALIAIAKPSKTLHAIGIFDANTFERRVMRLTGTRVEIGRALRLGTVVACVVIGAATCASALALRLEVAATSDNTAEHQDSHSALKVDPAINAGNILYQKRPVYPPDAKAKHISGAVVMAAIISKEGRVERLEVVSGPEELRASALDAVREWRYKPYLLNGDPTEVETKITVSYHIGK